MKKPVTGGKAPSKSSDSTQRYSTESTQGTDHASDLAEHVDEMSALFGNEEGQGAPEPDAATDRSDKSTSKSAKKGKEDEKSYRDGAEEEEREDERQEDEAQEDEAPRDDLSVEIETDAFEIAEDKPESDEPKQEKPAKDKAGKDIPVGDETAPGGLAPDPEVSASASSRGLLDPILDLLGLGGGTSPDPSAACFTRGTMILTDAGERPIEDLTPGDLIMTADNGLQVLRWIGCQTIGTAALADHPELRPIRIAASVLGDGQPARDLIVSQQHRVLVRSRIARRMFSTDEILIGAKFLVAIDGIDMLDDGAEVTYYHMLFDRHEVVFSNGALTESLYTGKEAMKMLGPAQRAEICAIFPQLVEADFVPRLARLTPQGARRRKFVERHAKNNTSLIC